MAATDRGQARAARSGVGRGRRTLDSAIVLLVATGTVFPLAPIDGLLGPPHGIPWLLLRLAWFPALVAALIGLLPLAGPSDPRRGDVPAHRTRPDRAGR